VAFGFSVYEVARVFVSVSIEIIAGPLTLATDKLAVKFVTVLPVESPSSMLFVAGIHALIAITVWVFVYSGAIFLAFVIKTFEESSVIVLLHSFALPLTMFVGSLEDVSVFVGVFSFAILLAILIFAFENGASFVLVCAEAGLNAVNVFALKLGSILVVVDAWPLSRIIDERACELLIGTQVVDALAVFLPGLERPFIFVVIREIHDPYALWHSSNRFSLVLVAVFEGYFVVLRSFF